MATKAKVSHSSHSRKRKPRRHFRVKVSSKTARHRPSGLERDVREWADDAQQELTGGVNEATREVTDFANASAQSLASFMQLMVLPFTIMVSMASAMGGGGSYGASYGYGGYSGGSYRGGSHSSRIRSRR